MRYPVRYLLLALLCVQFVSAQQANEAVYYIGSGGSITPPAFRTAVPSSYLGISESSGGPYLTQYTLNFVVGRNYSFVVETASEQVYFRFVFLTVVLSRLTRVLALKKG